MSKLSSVKNINNLKIGSSEKKQILSVMLTFKSVHKWIEMCHHKGMGQLDILPLKGYKQIKSGVQ